MINAKLWNQLTPDQQKIIEEAAQESADYEWELLEKSYQEDKKFLLEKGIKFTEPDDAFIRAMEAAVQPLYDESYQKNPWAKKMAEKIKAQAK
ncbi:hypothetical protein ACI7RC_21945 [Brevibacillus sp. B_LB10_24]|uniref:hypothetical protein n=1 Tax=Brevibacillus sp. B_LB10_24 TaxID=3380645 RepID=UPI0038BCB3F9